MFTELLIFWDELFLNSRKFQSQMSKANKFNTNTRTFDFMTFDFMTYKLFN